MPNPFPVGYHPSFPNGATSMQSSASVTCRAVGLLACVVTIPVLAMFGTPLAELAKGLWAGSTASASAGLRAAIPTSKGEACIQNNDSPQLANAPVPANYPTAISTRQATLARSSSGQVELILDRLHHLGASYCRLEPWGSRGNYRFCCRIAIDGDSCYTRYFEATGPDGVSAMLRVLRDIEAWRSFR